MISNSRLLVSFSNSFAGTGDPWRRELKISERTSRESPPPDLPINSPSWRRCSSRKCFSAATRGRVYPATKPRSRRVTANRTKATTRRLTNMARRRIAARYALPPRRETVRSIKSSASSPETFSPPPVRADAPCFRALSAEPGEPPEWKSSRPSRAPPLLPDRPRSAERPQRYIAAVGSVASGEFQMHRNRLMLRVSFGALVFAFAAPCAKAQEALPAIDIGGAAPTTNSAPSPAPATAPADGPGSLTVPSVAEQKRERLALSVRSPSSTPIRRRLNTFSRRSTRPFEGRARRLRGQPLRRRIASFRARFRPRAPLSSARPGIAARRHADEQLRRRRRFLPSRSKLLPIDRGFEGRQRLERWRVDPRRRRQFRFADGVYGYVAESSSRSKPAASIRSKVRCRCRACWVTSISS